MTVGRFYQLAKKKNRKVVRYRRPLNINVGMIIFALIFLYMAFYLYTYLRRDKVEFYEVVEGKNSRIPAEDKVAVPVL